jgi:ATP-grasp domain, R2K clade family 3
MLDKIMTKPRLCLQTDLFWEEINIDYIATIAKHFEIVNVDARYFYTKNKDICFRGSLNVAKRLSLDYSYTDCKKWIPIFREYVLSPRHTLFNDLGYFANYVSEFDFPLYIRPSDGYKSFSGQVFPTKDKFIEEYNYLTKNLNYSDDLMCVTSPIKNIQKEWRTVFIDNKFIDGCLYMQGNGIVETESTIPSEVVELAKKIAKNDYFLNIFNFVIDICESDGKLFLLEINSFESGSFYAMDLDKIYKNWADSIKNI